MFLYKISCRYKHESINFTVSFILPYFDYCLSLSIYYSKTILQKLCNFYYLCIVKLFKFNLNGLHTNRINNFLEGYGLAAFQHRFVMKLLTFSYKIYTCSNSPPILNNQ